MRRLSRALRAMTSRFRRSSALSPAPAAPDVVLLAPWDVLGESVARTQAAVGSGGASRRALVYKEAMRVLWRWRVETRGVVDGEVEAATLGADERRGRKTRVNSAWLRLPVESSVSTKLSHNDSLRSMIVIVMVK